MNLDTVFTPLHADVVACCPFDSYQDYVAVGTYKLESGVESSEQKRLGELRIYKIDHSQLIFITSANTSGILDLKWTVFLSLECILVATSIGWIYMYTFQNEKLVLVREIDLNTKDSTMIVLSIDVHENNIVASCSDGTIVMTDMSNFSSFHAHSLEAWTVRCHRTNSNILYTGSDDSSLKIWDLRGGLPSHTLKHHTAGVCSVLQDNLNEYKLYSGGYDENLYVLDQRMLNTPVKKLCLQGGVWRLQSNDTFIFAACMHAGLHVVSTKSNVSLVNYRLHESIAYGVDWVRSHQNSLVSCSFYDNSVHYWMFSPPENELPSR